MPESRPLTDPAIERARAWRDASHAAVCDVIEPWEHGTVVRSTRYPTYYEYNLVRVEDDPGMSADELEALADQALAGLAHRRIDFDVLAAGETVREQFAAHAWRPTRVLWMRYEGEPVQAPASNATVERALTHTPTAVPPDAAIVREAPYDEAEQLRDTWHTEDFFTDVRVDYERYRTAAREVAMSRDARTFVVQERRAAVAYAQLECVGARAEITQVYVHPLQRGRGLGTAVVRAAIAAAADTQDLWITADDEERPKHLYARLGFRSVWPTLQFLLPTPRG